MTAEATMQLLLKCQALNAAEKSALRELLAENVRLRDALEEIDVEVEGDVDGAPDAGHASKLANRVAAIVARARRNSADSGVDTTTTTP